MKLSKRQKEILYGMILGDAYIQKTGSQNARLRLEHSLKQKAYMDWKYQQLSNLFRSSPRCLQRKHPQSRQVYKYIRLQSHSSLVLGRIRKQFYNSSGKKMLPENLADILHSPLTIAVWYMDDGYYDRRDKSVHIYLPVFLSREMECLVKTFRQQHQIIPKWYCRPDRKGCQLNFTGIQRDRFLQFIDPYLITEMRYKTPLDPVTTEDEN